MIYYPIHDRQQLGVKLGNVVSFVVAGDNYGEFHQLQTFDGPNNEIKIIPGKGSGQLKKKVLRFLDQKDVKQLYHRVEKDGDNWGRLFVHFRFDAPRGRSRRR